MFAAISSDDDCQKKLLASLNSGRKKTTNVWYFPHREELEDNDDALTQVPMEFMEFIKGVPPVAISPENITKIAVADYRNQLMFIERKMFELFSDKSAVEAEIHSFEKNLNISTKNSIFFGEKQSYYDQIQNLLEKQKKEQMEIEARKNQHPTPIIPVEIPGNSRKNACTIM